MRHSIVGFDLLDAGHELRTRGGVDLEPAEIADSAARTGDRSGGRTAAVAPGRHASSWPNASQRGVPVRDGHDVVAVRWPMP